MAGKKILFLSSFPPRECGIATFTKDLTDSIQKRFGNNVGAKIIAVNESPSSVYKYGRNVAFTINEQDISSYEAAARKVNRMKSVTGVNIQHEFGIFGGEYGEYILRFMELLNKKVITTFHTVLEDPPEKMKEVVRSIFDLSDSIVVMTDTAKRMLAQHYGVDRGKILVIPHGVPGVEFAPLEKARRKYGIAQKNVLLTFGLLSRGKGIEKVIGAMPEILRRNPDTVYLVVGETHPRVRQHEGESYRQELMALAEANGSAQNVKFLDKFLTQQEVIECLRMSTIYIAPSLDPRQICSGTVSYALGAGKAVISSRSKYNREVLSRKRGIMLAHNEPERFAAAANRLLCRPDIARVYEKRAFEYSRCMAWPNVATKYYTIFCGSETADSGAFSRVSRISFRHFARLTDDFGMIQFSDYTNPDPSSGYTLDDNARALVVSVKAHERFGTKKMLSYTDTFLRFLERCQTGEGRFHNIIDGNKEFADDIGSEDSFGRAVWALGTVVNSGLPQEYRLRARNMLEKTVSESPEIGSPRAQADTLIGILNLREHSSSNQTQKLEGELINSLVSKYEEVSDGSWNWFEDYLTYGNSRIPEALFEAQPYYKAGPVAKIAKEAMDFLTKVLFVGGNLVPIGQEKWYHKDKERSMYDQQPIEAATMTTAYLKAFECTHDEGYKMKARNSFDWFLGKNSMSQMVYDEATGGCFDGLTRGGVNTNQGAESTVSYLLARLAII